MDRTEKVGALLTKCDYCEHFQSSIKSGVTTFASFKPTGLDDISDRADVVYSLPGP